jgi:hypothetical protein
MKTAITARSQLNLYKRIPVPVKVAAELVFQALHDPRCAEVRKALGEMNLLDHELHTIHLENLHFQLVHALPLARLVKGKTPMTLKAITSEQQGGSPPSLKHCILMGLMILLMTIASYMFAAYTDMRSYQNNCADVISMFDPNRSASSFYKTVLNFTYMVFNKEHTKHCELLQKKYGNMATALANQLHESISSFQGRIAVSAAIVTSLVGIFSEGVRALICIAAKFLGNLGSICDQNCKNSKKKSKSKSASEEEEEEEE